jgi:hypothetical protein
VAPTFNPFGRPSATSNFTTFGGCGGSGISTMTTVGGGAVVAVGVGVGAVVGAVVAVGVGVVAVAGVVAAVVVAGGLLTSCTVHAATAKQRTEIVRRMRALPV